MMIDKGNRKAIALSEIGILIIGIFAFIWMINGLPGVSAAGGGMQIGSSCIVPGVSAGTCISTSTCASQGGKSYPNYCPGLPTDVQCCITPINAPAKGTTGGSFDFTSTVAGAGTGALVNRGINLAIPPVNPAPAKIIETESLQAQAADAAKKLSGTLPPSALPSVGSSSNFWGKTWIGATTFATIAAYVGVAVAAVGGYFGMKAVARAVHANSDWTAAFGTIGAGAGAIAGTLILFAGSIPVAGWVIAAAATVVAGIIGIFSKSVQESGVVVFYCNQWQPQTGGANCDLCNHQNVPCSLYQCKSLGQSCAFIQSDPSNNGASFCFYNNSNDINPPFMVPDSGSLTPGYYYQNSTAVSPPDRGVQIIDTKTQDGCALPFSTVSFGVNTLNELTKAPYYAACKVSFTRMNSYESMSNYIDGSGLKLNHTMILKVPEINTSVGQSNMISAYVRCQDANGNADTGNFVFQMCVQKGPDLTPPVIESTSLDNNTKVASNVTNATVAFYVNKPAICKWSFKPGEDYSNMENNMSCANESTQINLNLDYACSANLTGISQSKKTFYYVRCQDLTPQRNTNIQDYVYSLSSSPALVIKNVSPNATVIKDSTSPVPVTITASTIGGAYDGNAVCSYSTTGRIGDYVIFDNTSSYKSSTTVYDTAGPQTYYIRCSDLGGNVDTKVINFNVSVDNTAPLISRAYYDNGQMKIITSEKASCEYSTSSCDYNFGDGTNITSYDGINHNFPWNTATDLYIKCEDIYGNLPSTGTCSIIVRAYGNQNS